MSTPLSSMCVPKPRRSVCTEIAVFTDSSTAVDRLNSLTAASGQRTHDHAIREFVAWYCSDHAVPVPELKWRMRTADGTASGS
jgi:hypothetical protein